MHRAVWLGLILILCPACLALPQGFYVGGGLQRCLSGEEDSWPGIAEVAKMAQAASGFWNLPHGIAFPDVNASRQGFGGQLEMGWVGRHGSAYVAWRLQGTQWSTDTRWFTQSAWDSAHGGWTERHHFRSERFLAGLRIHPAFPRSAVSPVFGGALSYGRADRSHTDHHYWLDFSAGRHVDRYTEDRQTSRYSFGWLLETGILVRTRTPLAFSFLYQSENLNVELPRGEGIYTLRNASMASWQLGTYYRF